MVLTLGQRIKRLNGRIMRSYSTRRILLLLLQIRMFSCLLHNPLMRMNAWDYGVRCGTRTSHCYALLSLSPSSVSMLGIGHSSSCSGSVPLQMLHQLES